MTAVRNEATGIATTITLDAPARRNALSAAVISDLNAALDGAAADPAIRVVVLAHAGPVFSSGMDLTAVTGVAPADQPIVAFPALLQRIYEFDKPVIAAVTGKARAGGIGLIAACDLAVGAADVDFAFTEVRLGLVPAVISVPLLPRVAPRALQELFLTGATFDAARAEQIGLLSRVVPVGGVPEAVVRYIDQFAGCEPAALAGTKALLRRDRSGVPMAADFAAMSAVSAEYFTGPAAAEGIAAFAAKRPPRWAE